MDVTGIYNDNPTYRIMIDLSLHIHILAWLTVGGSVGLFALAGSVIDRLRPVRSISRTAKGSQHPPRT